MPVTIDPVPVPIPKLLTLACLACVTCLVLLPTRAGPWARAFAKLGASTCFVALAVVLGAMSTRYGQFVLAALLFSWIGDALLLSGRSAAFTGGLAAFLAAHLLYASAFLLGETGAVAMAVAAAAALPAAAGVLRWLLPRVPAGMKAPVVAYVLVILAMCVVASGFSQSSGRWSVLAGALIFAVSDVAVARERFVRASPVNPAWGLPAYFVAQLLLAWSVAGSP